METIDINKKSKQRQKTLDPMKLEVQEQYMDKVREINEKWAAEKGRKPVVVIVTFGCQMNNLNMKKGISYYNNFTGILFIL